jgi:hypothetical protein
MRRTSIAGVTDACRHCHALLFIIGIPNRLLKRFM